MKRLIVGAVTAVLVLSGVVLAPSAFAAAPTITSFSPTSGTLYTKVTITGTGFISPATVKFNGVASTSTSVQSATSVTAVVPKTAFTGKVSVTTAGGTATSTASFQVVAGLHLSPVSGPPTTRVTVYVAGFAVSEAVDLSFDTTTLATMVTDAHGTAQVAVTVPASASPGAHSFTVVGRRSGSAAQATFTVRTDVTQIGFDNAHTGVNPFENQLSPTTIAKTSQAWSTTLPSPSNTTPAVVGGIVYETFNDGTVRAFDATTGAQKWSYSTGGTTTYSSPAVSAGVVYAGSGDGKLNAINATTGALKWSFATGAQVHTSPTVVGTTVYFGSDDHYVYAVNSADGTQRWRYQLSIAVRTAPTYADGKVFVGDINGIAAALDASTGAAVWRLPYGSLSDLYAPLIVSDGLVVADSYDGLEVVDEDDGTVEWKTPTSPGSSSYAAAVDSGMVFVPDLSGIVTAYDAATGTVLWKRDLSATAGALRQPVAVANGIVFVGDSYTYALRESDGALLRTFTAGGVYGGVAVSDGTITLANTRKKTLVRYALPASATPGIKRIASPAVRRAPPHTT